ncbi:MAG: hypothetical protein ACOYM3_04675 [Terrimicrobiaceae bacterium]
MGSVVSLVTAAFLILISASASAITYADWIATFPSLTGGDTAATADPDSDGVINLMEYALYGLSPIVSDSPGTLTTPFRQIRNADGSYNAPTNSITAAQRAAAASIHMVLRYRKRAGTEGIRYIPQTNQKDLKNWGWGDSAIFEWTDAGYTYARTISDMEVWDGRAFMRLKVEVIP